MVCSHFLSGRSPVDRPMLLGNPVSEYIQESACCYSESWALEPESSSLIHRSTQDRSGFAALVDRVVAIAAPWEQVFRDCTVLNLESANGFQAPLIRNSESNTLNPDLIPHSVVSRIQDFNNSPYMPGATLRVCGQFPDPIGF